MNEYKLKQEAINFARITNNPKSYLHEIGLIDGYLAGYKRAIENITNVNNTYCNCSETRKNINKKTESEKCYICHKKV